MSITNPTSDNLAQTAHALAGYGIALTVADTRTVGWTGATPEGGGAPGAAGEGAAGTAIGRGTAVAFTVTAG